MARAWLGVAVLLAAWALHVTRAQPAAAEVTHLHGFRATVDGFTSWYGSYGMGPLGTAWCIDHGIRSPDPAFAYAPADLSGITADRQSAVAWVLARHGQGADPVAHAGVMLAVHDLMGATYPSGHLDVDRLTAAATAGFDGRADEVLAIARAAKADGLAHAALRGPLGLTLSVGPPGPDGAHSMVARLVDQAGTGVGSLGVRILWADQVHDLTTADDGTASVLVPPGAAPTEVVATAAVPHLPLDAWASTTTPAQRVALPTLDELRASTVPSVPETTTSTTTSSTTSSTTSTTTSTTSPTTTAPPTTVPPAPSTVATAPPATVLSTPPLTATLPRTGIDTLTLALLATGLLLLGWSCIDLSRRQRARRRLT